MKRLYETYFYIPKHGKIRDKVMLTRVVVMTMLMIACLMNMSFTAYAFFAHNVSSGSNTIQAAVFETTVTILAKDDERPVKVVTSDHKSHLATLTSGIKYKVTISRTSDSTASGFCVVSSENFPNKYHTQQIGGKGRSSAKDFTFYLTVEETAAVQFFAHWGTSSYYDQASANNPLYITAENNDITMSKAEVKPSVSDRNESTAAQTTGKPVSTTQPVQTNDSRTTTTASAETTDGYAESTSSTSSTVSIGTGTSTSIGLNATDNTINAATTAPYTYDENQGEDSTYNAKVNGTETVKTDITDQE